MYPRLSGFYFLYFATLGVVLPYWSLYLQSLGLEPVYIGGLLSITLVTKVVAPNLWGWIADRTGKRMAIVRLACLATAVCFAGIYGVGNSLTGLALVMLLFSFFWNAALPQFEAITLNHLGTDVHRYSRVRLWGSVGFIVTSLAGGVLVQHLGIGIVPTFLLGLFVMLWLNSLMVPERGGSAPHLKHEPLGRVLRQSSVLALFVICFLNQASHGPYYAFFSIYLEELGYSREMIGGLWSLGVIAEIGIFMLMPRLLLRTGPRRLMLIAMSLASLRWLLIASFAANPWLLSFAQLLHAFSFGLYHAVGIYLIHHFFTGNNQGRGQALYSSVSFGAGGALGSLAAGYLWEGLGGAGTFGLAAAVSGLGVFVVWRWLLK